jgi:hypothetical protein
MFVRRMVRAVTVCPHPSCDDSEGYSQLKKRIASREVTVPQTARTIRYSARGQGPALESVSDCTAAPFGSLVDGFAAPHQSSSPLRGWKCCMRVLGLLQPGFAGDDDRLGAIGDLKFAEDVRDVVTYGLW